MKFLRILLLVIFTQILFAGRIDVTSSSVEAEIDQVHFIGNAEIKFDESWIHAQRVNVFLDDKNETKSYEAIGAVNFLIKYETYFFKGRANKVTYEVFTQRYVLSGLAVIEDNNFLMKRYITGDEIVLDLFTESLEVTGGSVSTHLFIKLHDVGSFFGF